MGKGPSRPRSEGQGEYSGTILAWRSEGGYSVLVAETSVGSLMLAWRRVTRTKLCGMTRAVAARRVLSAPTRPRADRRTRRFLGGSDSPPSCPPVRPAVKITYLDLRTWGGYRVGPKGVRQYETKDHFSFAPSSSTRLRRPCHARHVTAHRKIYFASLISHAFVHRSGRSAPIWAPSPCRQPGSPT